jgi:hypothetical protein
LATTLIDGLFLRCHVPSLSVAKGFKVPSAGAPLDFIGVKRAGVSAGDPSLNGISQLLELHVVEAFFLFHLSQCLVLFMPDVKAGGLNEFMPL